MQYTGLHCSEKANVRSQWTERLMAKSQRSHDCDLINVTTRLFSSVVINFGCIKKNLHAMVSVHASKWWCARRFATKITENNLRFSRRPLKTGCWPRSIHVALIGLHRMLIDFNLSRMFLQETTYQIEGTSKDKHNNENKQETRKQTVSRH